MTTTTENLYVGDGSTVLYSFTFPYIKEDDVKVTLNGLTASYSLANATTVEFVTAPASGVSIRIYRSTPADAISAEFYPGSAVRAQDLNGNFEQTLFLVQESKTILDNSDAASVVGIANEALTTANQASATANAVSGTANEALTAATEAEAKSDQAVADASAANDEALAARIVADAALNPGSVVSDLADVSTTVANTNQVLAWSGSEWAPVDQSGGGGGGDITYSGAAAWGDVSEDRVLLNGLNIASVTKGGTGEITFTFATPMPDANYSVTATINQVFNSAQSNLSVVIYDKTANGFTARTKGSTSYTNYAYAFAVFATNALPPKGGTGIDSWGTVDETTVNGPCNVPASFNVASVTRTASGRCDVVFTTPMPTANYAVNATVFTEGTTSVGGPVIGVFDIKTTGFSVSGRDSGGNNADRAFSFTVNATNATLPLTVTQEQIEAAINNPGVSGWATVDKTSSNGPCNVPGSFNVASVTRTGSGEYAVVFTTAMPTANYSIQGSAENTDGNSSGRVFQWTEKTATGFRVRIKATTDSSIDDAFCFSVNASNVQIPNTFTIEQFNDLVARVTALENA